MHDRSDALLRFCYPGRQVLDKFCESHCLASGSMRLPLRQVRLELVDSPSDATDQAVDFKWMVCVGKAGFPEGLAIIIDGLLLNQ